VNGWKREQAKLRQQYEKEFALGTADKLRTKQAKYPMMEEALYVWFRQMQARDMTLTEEVIRKKGKKLGQLLGVAEGFGYSDGWLHNLSSAIKSSPMPYTGKLGPLTRKVSIWHIRICVPCLKKGGLQQMMFTIKTRVGCFGDRCPQEPWPLASVLVARRRRSVLRFQSAAMPQELT
jgi:hypothetical protein